jgi:hypothetical protein
MAHIGRYKSVQSRIDFDYFDYLDLDKIARWFSCELRVTGSGISIRMNNLVSRTQNEEKKGFGGHGNHIRLDQ